MAEVSYTRRRFALTTACALAPLRRLGLAQGPAGAPWDGPAVVRKLYFGGRPSWPRPDADLRQDIAGIEARLAEVERRYPGQVRFTGGEMVNNAAEMDAWLAKKEDCDVVLAFNMVTIVYPMLRKLVESGQPSLMFAVPYAGHDWTHAAAFVQRGARLELIASSDFSDLDPYVPLFRAIHHLKHSKVLLVSPPASHPDSGGYAKQFGTAFAYPTYLDLKGRYDAVSADKASKLASEFIRAAVKVVEPTRPEIVDSMRLALAIEALLEEHRANAIAIDCLGGFGRRELPAYPCVAFSRLNDAGMYGVCECDLESTMTQLLVTSCSGMPGFVSDPVFDTSRNEVIHAHCVSATRLRGVGGEACPYLVRTHLEDHKGVSMQVLAPAGGAVTVARFADAGRMMVSTGEALGNVDDERGCRTKIRTKVKDARELLAGWAAALKGPMPGTRDLLHRVVFYGDHVQAVERLGRMTGFQVIHEA
jgi:hypothetical protein